MLIITCGPNKLTELFLLSIAFALVSSKLRSLIIFLYMLKLNSCSVVSYGFHAFTTRTILLCIASKLNWSIVFNFDAVYDGDASVS